jgi:hypothetical protein
MFGNENAKVASLMVMVGVGQVTWVFGKSQE